jgi:very-short-patch-repair endonuclease
MENMKYAEIKEYSRKLRREQTYSEKLLWYRLSNRQLDGFKFLRQHPILVDRDGNNLSFFIADFYCAKAKLAIEIDGKIHQDKVEHDVWRQKIIEGMGLTVLRFRNEEIDDIEGPIERIRDYLKLTSPKKNI